jgi:cysteinyl-tRNA synthetase
MDVADRYTWSINLLARNNCADLARCLQSIAQHSDGHSVEVVVIDNGSTDDTLAFLQDVARKPCLNTSTGAQIPVEVLFADHNLGFAGGRNATMRASTGRFVVMLDTSIELADDIWAPLERVLNDPTIGVAGPYGLVTNDLRDFEESTGPDVDAIEGYLLAFRRALLNDVGFIDEKFRFYRLADIYWSFFFKAAGLRAVALADVAQSLIKHPHSEWYSLEPEEQQAKSKKNFDLFRDRWHHGESLLVANAGTTEGWMSHDDPRHIQATHTHSPDELPLPGQPHTHVHRHLADHEHTHAHYHEAAAVAERS